MTLLCTAITASTIDGMIEQAGQARAAGADLVELRLDFLDDPRPDVDDLMRRMRGPVIATCRPRDEGGQYDGDEGTRVAILEQMALANADYIDCEFEAWSRSLAIRERIGGVTEIGTDTAQPRRKLIVSHHDFERTPGDLATIFASLAASRAHVVKVATQAESIVDSLRMLSALRESAKTNPTIALCMGEAGLMTRVLARKLGAFLTFAAVKAGHESAPGQPTTQELRRMYRWDHIDAETDVYGVVGCPIGHSMSPAIHNAALGDVGVNAVYLPFRVEPGEAAFAAFVNGCMERPWLSLRGLSVTIPHKLSALRFVGDAVEPLARKIGAVNTVTFDAAGKPFGVNTDYAAILDSLTIALSCDRADLRGVPVAVLGAGGAARAAVAGLTDCGADVTIYNRTADKAATLAEAFACRARDWAERSDPRAKIVINTTSVGMHPHEDASPLPTDALTEAVTVFDTVYNPIRTRLLSEADAAGCRTIDGVTMFVRQAAAQFKLFTGSDAPVERMRNFVVQQLEA